MKDKNYFQRYLKQLESQMPFANNTEIAYRAILNDILEGELKPGDKLLQDNLADLFNMSRTPVRDALIRLEREKYIEKNGKSGYQVHKVSFREFLEFCDFRMLIEAHAARLSANSMTETELEELKDTMEKFNDACDEKKTDRVFFLDEKFHELVVKGAHNDYLYTAYKSYLSKKKFYFTLNVKEQKNIQRMKKRHNRIYEAIRDYDEVQAYESMIEHLKIYDNFFNK